MFRKPDSTVQVRGQLYRKHTILFDANIPYKLAADRNKNKLFFCINADEFSDQSFHSVIMDLGSGLTSIIPGIRNGFACAVDNMTSSVYLGGSDGIFKYNYDLNDVNRYPLVDRTDIFDMGFHNELYYVDTASQNLYVYRNEKKTIIPEVNGCLIHHFVFNRNQDLIYINPAGLYIMPKGAKSPKLCENVSRQLNFRGATTDANGWPYFIAENGIYALDETNKQLELVLPVENGYGLAFDKDNNIIYSDERTISKLVPVK